MTLRRFCYERRVRVWPINNTWYRSLLCNMSTVGQERVKPRAVSVRNHGAEVTKNEKKLRNVCWITLQRLIR